MYGANTLGAVAGCFLAGFVLLQLLGVQGSLMVAGGTALAVGAAAVLLGLRVDQSPQHAAASGEQSPDSIAGGSRGPRRGCPACQTPASPGHGPWPASTDRRDEPGVVDH